MKLRPIVLPPRVLSQLRLFLVALQFYSRIPVTGRLAAWLGHDPAWLAPATRYFPLVGVVVASLTAIVYATFGLLLPHSVALVVAIAAGLMLTGAFHEDGLADTCDALGGHHDRARLLAIMQDSRIGTYGAAALILMLVGRFEILAALDPSWVGVTLVTAAAASRGCAIIVIWTLPYLRSEPAVTATPTSTAGEPDPLASGGASAGFASPGKQPIAKPIAHNIAAIDTLIALAIAIAPSVLAALWTGQLRIFFFGMVCAGIALLWLRRRLRIRLGGYTGDTLGAVQQLTEIAFMAGALAMMALAAEGIGPDGAPADTLD